MALSENYFKSKDVRVFPSSFRGTYDNTTTFDPEARLNTEANFIVPKVNGNKASYIVNYNTNTIKFVLGGYYFEINNLTDYDLQDKYLNIKLRDVTIAENQELDNKDSERKTHLLDTWEDNSDHILDILSSDSSSDSSISYFTGLKISAINPETAAYANIKLLTADGSINQEAILVDLDHGTGENTLLHGEGLKAAYENQTVFGTYNDNKEDTLFEVGKGSAENVLDSDGNITTKNRENALEISTTTTTINNITNINGATTITGNTKVEGTAEITSDTEIKGDLTISKDTESDSSTTGAIKVTGGIGISKNLNVGGNTNLSNKVIVNNSPTGSETNVKVDGTLNVTGVTTIASNVTINGDKTTLTKPVEITNDSSEALVVSGKTTIKKDLEIGDSNKVLVVKNSPATNEQNVTVNGTLKSVGKATFENGLEVTSGKATNLGGQLNVTGAVNINTNNQTNPAPVIIYGDTMVTGAVNIVGKVNSNTTTSTDTDTTLTTKGYVESLINNLDVESVGGTGKYIREIGESEGKISAVVAEFDKILDDKSNDDNVPTTKAVYDHINTQINKLNANKVGGPITQEVQGKTITDYHYLDSIIQTKGLITATKKSLTQSLVDPISSHEGIASAKATKDYVDSQIGALDLANIKKAVEEKNLIYRGEGNTGKGKQYAIETTAMSINKASWNTCSFGGTIASFAITSYPVDASYGNLPGRDGPVDFSKEDDDDTALSHVGWSNNIYAYASGSTLYVLNANHYFKATVYILAIVRAD